MNTPQSPDLVRCRACDSATRPLWRGKLLDMKVQYFECPTCKYVQTEQPHWLERAYAEAINDSDTGIMARNVANARIVIGTLWAMGALDGIVVDYAGGYGILVRLLRDYGVDALWSDPYCENRVARGFEHRGQPATLVTAFEAFEHFIEPTKELTRMLAIAPNLLLSTMLVPTPPPPHDDWWYYGREHGQHVGLFRLETLEMLARKSGKVLISDGHFYHLVAENGLSRRLWKLMLRFNRYVPRLVANRLTSKTWADHLLMSASKTDPG